jgi:hypothetical protein
MPQIYLRGKNPDPHWVGGWVNPTSGSDVVAKRKILPGI